MAALSYYTLQFPSQGIYKAKGSKFLAFAYPVDSEPDIRMKLETLRKKYFDARHHCYAYVLGPEKEKYRAFDDGEPSHSSGDPILGQIRSKNLTNVLLVVVRYFGGVKLGVGGLIQAYRAAAEEALAKAQIIEKDVTHAFLLTYDYSASAEVMRMIKEFNLKMVNRGFTEEGALELEVKAKDKARFLDKIKLLSSRGINLKLKSEGGEY